MASVESASVAPQPLAVEQVSARQLERQASAPEAFDRVPVEPFSDLAIAEERFRPRLDAERQLGARRAGPLRQRLGRSGREVCWPQRVAASTSSGYDHTNAMSSSRLPAR